ncbi:MAG: IS630 family transposase [Pleurocapsa sp.]
MPKKAYLTSHLSTFELKKLYQQSKSPIESRRWHLLWKVAQGWTIKNSAVAVGISYGYAQRIISSYNRDGVVGVLVKPRKEEKHTGGKAALLSPKQFEKLAQALKSKPSDGGIWTGVKVARWIEQETDKERVWNQRGWDYLKKCSYSWQRPRRKHSKGDPIAQTQFKQNLPILVEQLSQKYPNSKIEVWFFDEHRIGLKPILKKVWSPIGTRPTAVVQHQYEWLYVYGFVEPKSGKTLWYLIPRVNTEWMNVVLATFAIEAQANQNKIILLVQDRAGWHRSQKVHLPLGIETEFLPAYSPELQPAERLWSLVDEPIANENIETIDELEKILSQRCCILNQMTQEIKHLTNYHWLKYG